MGENHNKKTPERAFFLFCGQRGELRGEVAYATEVLFYNFFMRISKKMLASIFAILVSFYITREVKLSSVFFGEREIFAEILRVTRNYKKI